MRIYILLSLICITTALAAQSHHSLLRTGDAAYNDGEFEKAEINYRKSLEEKRTHKGNFNLGNTIYRQERYEEAVQFYESAANDADNDIRKSEAFFNLGNTHMRVDAYEDAVDAFKYAMALNPQDLDIRKNLYIAKLMYQKEQQQEQQQQQQQSQEPQDQDQQDQEEQDQEEQDQEQEQQQQQEPGEQGDQEEEQQKEGEEKEENQDESKESGEGESEQESTQELSKEDAQKLLQVIENEEQKVQEKLRKVSGKKKKPKKDW